MMQCGNSTVCRIVLIRLAFVSLAGCSCCALAGEPDLFDMNLEELLNVTVTAEKRVESKADVPVSVMVVNGAQLESNLLNNLESIQQLVPALTFRKGTTTANSALNLRGIGTISFSAASEPSTSTVVDGVVLARSGQAFADLFDIARVEVMPGPQGMLFGKNASAGVINIVTREPTTTPEARLYASISEGQEYRSGLSVSGPVS